MAFFIVIAVRLVGGVLRMLRIGQNKMKENSQQRSQ